MAKFKEYILEEGPFWDAICHGVKTGVAAFRSKRVEQSKPKEAKVTAKTLTQKILTAEGDDLKQVVKQMVDKGFTMKHGKVTKTPRVTNAKDWLLECIRTRAASASARSSAAT